MNTALLTAIDEQKASGRFAGQENFDRECWKEARQQELTDTFALLDGTLSGAFYMEGKYAQFLDLQSRLPGFRAGNVALVMAQRPDAMDVATFNEWKDRKCSVQAGEKGLKILVPVTYNRESDGQQGVAFRVAAAFDVSQTDAKDRAAPAVPAPDMQKLLSALLRRSPVRVIPDEKLGQDAAWSQTERAVIVQPGLGETAAFAALAREISKAYMKDEHPAYAGAAYGLPELSAAYIVCKRYGVDVSGFDFSHVAEYSDANGFDVKGLQKLLNDARTAANSICEQMELTLHPVKQQEKNQPER